MMLCTLILTRPVHVRLYYLSDSVQIGNKVEHAYVIVYNCIAY